MGIDLRDVEQPIGTLSGGERQCVAIARAVYFGAKVLILDEPTAALGVKQSGVVLKYILQARERGLGVIFITHNPHHAYPVGDRFLLLKRGRSLGYYRKDEISRDELTALMAGGAELEELSHELESVGGAVAEAATPWRRSSRSSASAAEPGSPGMTVATRRLALGSCPDSWGVWFADDPRQTPWQRFLDELAGVGYEWLELGPYGYLPTDPARLADELDRRGPDGRRRHDARRERAAPRRRLAGDPGQDPQGRRAHRRGRRPAPGLRPGARLPRRHDRGLPGAGAARAATSGRTLVRRHDELGRIVAEDYGVRLAVPPARRQPRGDAASRPSGSWPTPTRGTSTCAWTPGTWRTGGRTASSSSAATRTASATCTSSRWTRRWSTGPRGRTWPFGQAVALGASCEPPKGLPDVPSVRGGTVRSWTPSCSSSSSRTCTRSTSTCRRPSRPGPATTCAPSASAR